MNALAQRMINVLKLPQLTSLRFWLGIDLGVLVPVLQNCPRLETIYIPLDGCDWSYDRVNVFLRSLSVFKYLADLTFHYNLSTGCSFNYLCVILGCLVRGDWAFPPVYLTVTVSFFFKKKQ